MILLANWRIKQIKTVQTSTNNPNGSICREKQKNKNNKNKKYITRDK